jgi:geranylgeranyl pyrophosphate synthase
VTEIASIYGPVVGDLPEVGARLQRLASGRHQLLADTLSHVFETVGKQIRPALVLLCGRLGRYNLDALVTLAVSIEAVHTATLVHDDTVDRAHSRRGLATVNALWDDKIAILLGDFLFAQSAQLATQLNLIPIMELLSETVMAMSSGELRQYAASKTLLVDKDDYFQRIQGKTASLFAMCCQGGAIVSEQNYVHVEALRRYGTDLGMAFQIVDDVLDFIGDESVLGKPSGSDLRQGTITLPLIFYADDLRDTPGFWQALHDGIDVSPIIEAVRRSEAPSRALLCAREHVASARTALDPFPESEAKDALLELSEYVIRRVR